MTTVVLFPADQGACGLYRIIYPALAVAALGHDVRVATEGDNSPVRNGLVEPIGPADWEIKAGEVPEADIVVLQRPSSIRAPAIIRFLKRQGIRVVVELDDNFLALTDRNQAWFAYQRFAKGQSTGQSIAALSRSISLADKVVVSTPSLAAAYSADVVIENCVPASYLDVSDRVPGDPWPEVVGWAGSMSVHGGDLVVVGTGVRDALAVTGWSFEVVGQSRGVGRELLLDGDPPETGWLPIDQYQKEVSALGVGIAPLVDDAFNRAKSWLKVLEYGALGVPCVASALPEYERIGIAETVRKPRQWKSALIKVMSDEQFRADLVEQGRLIAAQWTYSTNAERWWEAWTG